MITTFDKNTALVLIDLQQLVVQLPAAHPIGPVIDNSAKLVAAFREAGLPVVIVNVNPVGSAASKTRKDAKSPAMTSLPDGALDIVPEIKIQNEDIRITKETWNAFYNTALHAELQKKGITGIVLAGVATSIGVEGTARSANEYGYNIAFASDAMTDLFEDAHKHSFKFIFPRIGEIGTTDEIIEKLGK
ncbi:isochorismatase family protein [Mucilaginibacter aquaedulcis]|uniref:isochorismatase family protein n=1 Tax=Mucilaginibacter aquaedulcis TaxID=1187081 RepID=UPI0025B5B60D|nr:isochorismatase family protein [Mucilaginibacter aquaedulcis]MDN3547342.1 isochorismatase family protein [Mucilaginibacter aquaedulcis]